MKNRFVVEKTKIYTKGTVNIPKKIREIAGIEENTDILVIGSDKGEIIIRRIKTPDEICGALQYRIEDAYETFEQVFEDIAKLINDFASRKLLYTDKYKNAPSLFKYDDENPLIAFMITRRFRDGVLVINKQHIKDLVLPNDILIVTTDSSNYYFIDLSKIKIDSMEQLSNFVLMIVLQLLGFLSLGNNTNNTSKYDPWNDILIAEDDNISKNYKTTN
jgi:AbrB family looped-hinge helix DNA binding protein